MPHYRPSFILGLDLGTRRDFTALSVLRQVVLPGGPVDVLYTNADAGPGFPRIAETTPHAYRYDLIELQRWRGEGYGVVIPRLHDVGAALRQAGYRAQREHGSPVQEEPAITILVDHTGVGVAVVEDIRNAGIACQGITITGGDQVARDRDDWRVPKRELVARTQVLLETGRVKIARSLELAPALVAELDNFQVKTSPLTGNDSYGAGADWRDGHHDDLVLAVAMAAWFGEYDVAGQVAGMRFQLELRAHYERELGPGWTSALS